jgi:hypothetical protein
MWKGSEGLVCAISATIHRFAGVAQLVEHLICNQRVRGSNPFASSREQRTKTRIFRQAADSVSGATGFSNALHSDLFRRVVIFAQSARAILGFPVSFLRQLICGNLLARLKCSMLESVDFRGPASGCSAGRSRTAASPDSFCTGG